MPDSILDIPPDRARIGPQPGPQTAFAQCEADICIFGGAAFGGKLSPLDSWICTPFGGKLMGDIAIGDQVSNPDGSVARVIGVWPQGVKKVYRITCDDGSSCEVGGEHLWKYRIGRVRRFRKKSKDDAVTQWYIGTTEKLIETLNLGKQVIIPLSEPVEFTVCSRNKTTTWPVDPYTLGVILGDGCTRADRLTVTSADADIIANMGINPYRHVQSSGEASEYFFKTSEIKPTMTALGLWGLMAHEKFIPDSYKRLNIEGRRNLLKGLFDTDGYVDSRGHVSYCTTSSALAYGVQWLCRSLGYTATVTTKKPTYTYAGEKRTGMLAYTVYVGGKNGLELFSLQRKCARCKDKTHKDRSIVEIEESRTTETQCITVDNPNGLYLTDDFIVTHNSYGILLEPLRAVRHPRFNGVIFRRESPQITSGGGLWDTSTQIYPATGATPKSHILTWEWPNGASLKFTHLQHEKDKIDHQGAQYVFIGFDELTHFTEGQFFYLLSRNRPPDGYEGKCWCRATTNPDADSWVREFIDWWVDEDGKIAPEKVGVVRYFTRRNEEIIWVDAGWRDEWGNPGKTVTVIPSFIDDNQVGIKKNPEYRSNLLAQDDVNRRRLLLGDWNVSYRGGMFDPTWFIIEDEAPPMVKTMRYWDMAGTVKTEESKDPDYTAGGLVGYDEAGYLWILDMVRMQESPAIVEKRVLDVAKIDGRDVPVGIEQEKGSAGMHVCSYYQRKVLAGYEVYADPVSGDKVTRAKPWCAKAQQGYVKVLRRPWTRDFLAEAGSFPLGKRDQIDTISGADKLLTATRKVLHAYVPANYAHRRRFRKGLTDFEVASPGILHIYIVCWREPDSGLWASFFSWNREKKSLKVYNELYYPSPLIEAFVEEVVEKAVVNVRKRDDRVSVKRIYGNEEMFRGGFDCKKVFKKAGMRIRQNQGFEQAGAILETNRMFGNSDIAVHEDCVKTDVQWRTWAITDAGRPDEKVGYPGAKALLCIVNELKTMGEMTAEYEARPYSQSKQKIRERLVNADMRQETTTNLEEKENEWLST